MKEVRDPNLLSTAISIVAAGIARADPVYTVEWLRALPEGNARDMAVQNAVHPLAGGDPRLAMGLVSLVANENFRANVVSTVISQYGSKDFAAASAWAAELPVGQVRDRALQQLCFMGASRKAADAFALAAQIGDETMRMSVNTFVVGQWARQDAAAASEWLLTLPAGHWRDLAVQSFAVNAVGRDPAAAADWAESIQDESLRNSTLQSVAAQWFSQDKAAAVLWLENSSLPASEREQFKSTRGAH